MWLRQLKRYSRSKSRLIGALGQPLLFLFALGFGLGPVFAQAGKGDYITFLVPGIVAMSVLFTSMFSGIEIIWDRQFGFLKETLVAPVSRFQIMVGRTFGGATISIFQGFVILLLAHIVGFRLPTLTALFFTFLFMALIALTFTALGTAIASRMQDFHGFQLIMNFLVMPLVFLSGALFPIDGLPKVMEIIVKCNPLSYGIDGMRGALSGTDVYGLIPDLCVLGVTTAVLFIIGSYMFSKIQV
jgi:ABC-2 type transport system permease protein